MKLLPVSIFSTHRHRGFGLVEIMVGLVIGMLAAVVMLQVFALSEERKRTTTGGGDALTNGAITFHQLQRDISQAGYGFVALGLLNCNIRWPVASGANIATAVRLAPVTINPPNAVIPAGDPNTDTLLLMYGNADGQPQGNIIMGQTGSFYRVQMASAFSVNDRVIASPAACAGDLLIDQVTGLGNAVVPGVSVATGAAGSTALYNLGNGPTISAYAIRNGNLTVCNYLVNDCGLAASVNDASIWMPVANNIVSMRALYAHDIDVPMDGYAEDAAGFDQTTPTTNCGWMRTPAVHLAITARNSQFNKEVVTKTGEGGNAPSWQWEAAASLVGANGALGPDAAADEPWKHYRYKVFQSLIPIRNVALVAPSSTC
ncbi:PilW family protein [Noviherbaspirillum saxi]|uniref:Type IV pilus assembly protein PilW n=1 Tax=Noviherbaspirillum saxi TaxID=2320863 RepID=A0A3A3FXN5_9BURK|nr:PilW family protein [Noviherbaspirillum saxi]RJF98971.1 hypothetical protein D3871_10955 [Noviherbaspirillum saxi]